MLLFLFFILQEKEGRCFENYIDIIELYLILTYVDTLSLMVDTNMDTSKTIEPYTFNYMQWAHEGHMSHKKSPN